MKHRLSPNHRILGPRENAGFMMGTLSTSVRPRHIMFRSQLTPLDHSILDFDFLCHRKTLTLQDSCPCSCPQSYFKGKILVRKHAAEGHKEELVIPTCGMRRCIQSCAGCRGASVTHMAEAVLSNGNKSLASSFSPSSKGRGCSISGSYSCALMGIRAHLSQYVPGQP